jgi:hypothetical protein
MSDDTIERDLFREVKKAIISGDELHMMISITKLHIVGVPIHKFNYCEEEDSFLISERDSTEDTGFWSEEKVYYDCQDDMTYTIRIDQDGGSEVTCEEEGLVY